MRLITAWKTILARSTAVWTQFAQLMFGALSFLDPGAALYVWNLMPEVVADRVPPFFIQVVGATLFGLALLTIVLRIVRQPRMEAKVEKVQAEKVLEEMHDATG